MLGVQIAISQFQIIFFVLFSFLQWKMLFFKWRIIITLTPQDKIRIWNKRNDENTDKMHHFTRQRTYSLDCQNHC